MDFEIKHAADSQTTAWSGGTTTELYIYPEGSDFQKRDFMFRISRATVELEESVFTALPDVNRTLMILEGNLELIHEGHHQIKLKPFEQDSFKGEWNTTSRGKVTDFNLMTRENTSGVVKYLKFENNAEFIFQSVNDLDLFYLADGILFFDDLELLKGDVLILNSAKKLKFQSENCDLIHVGINLN